MSQDGEPATRENRRWALLALGYGTTVGAGMQYGWVRIKWGGCSWNGYVVKDYAWGDPGDQIKTGQTQLDEDVTQVAPPATKDTDAAPLADSQGSLGLLALGAVGLKAWRKSRRSVSSIAPLP